MYSSVTLKGTLVVALVLICVPQSAAALEVMLDASRASYQHGDTFLMPVRIDAAGECLNTVALDVRYDPAVLSAVDVGRGHSILTLWSEPPAIDEQAGVITFSGGIPGGYCGRVVGDPGLTNVLATLVFEVAETQATSTTVDFGGGLRVFAHDGQATPLSVSPRPITLAIEERDRERLNEWITTVREDTIAPEHFEIRLERSEHIAGGKYYIEFHTTDKQSGIDHYEVLETDPERFGWSSWLPRRSHWIEAESPYVLRDQDLTSRIMVRALDKNGNERVVTYTPPQDLLARVRSSWPILVLALLSLMGLVLTVYLMRRSRSRRRGPVVDLRDDGHAHEPGSGTDDGLEEGAGEQVSGDEPDNRDHHA